MREINIRDPSRSQVDKAGSRIRKWLRDELETDDTRVGDALDVLFTYRSLHSRPLVSANMGLRSMIATEGCQLDVTQRLKRLPTIIDKLVREPTLPLSKMQDIGGVRAILRSVDEIRRVEARLRKRRPVVRVNDYIANPRASGYRGVHVVVEYSDRSIEVQLRTQAMHDWALTVEQLSSRFGTNYKMDGSSTIQLLMAAVSEAMALEEEGSSVSEELLATMRRLRSDAGLGQG